jgi:hypothetical protein
VKFASELNNTKSMKSIKLNTDQDAKNSHVDEEPDDLTKLVKKTRIQDKVLKKMIEEIEKSTNDK